MINLKLYIKKIFISIACNLLKLIERLINDYERYSQNLRLSSAVSIFDRRLISYHRSLKSHYFFAGINYFFAGTTTSAILLLFFGKNVSNIIIIERKKGAPFKFNVIK